MQDQGGTTKTIEEGVRLLAELLPRVNDVKREPIPASEIILGTNCGGSDGNSGVTANPALGVASDMLVAGGGTSVIGETPEIYGAEHLLTPPRGQRRGRREARRAHQVVGVVHGHLRRRDQQQPVARQQGRRPDDDLRKIARRGRQGRQHGDGRRLSHTPSRCTAKGFVVMDTPGYDPVEHDRHRRRRLPT